MPKHRKPAIDDPIFWVLCILTAIYMGFAFGEAVTLWWT